MDKLKKLRTLKTGQGNKDITIKRRGYSMPSVSSLSELAQQQHREALQREQAKSYGKSYEETTDDRNFLEKALNLGQHQGFFGDLFETLGRPMRTVQGALTEKNPFEGALQGFTGKKQYSGEGVLKSLGLINENTPGWIKSIGGFAADIATDPLTFTNAPFRLAGKGIKKGSAMLGKAASSALSQTERGSKLLNGINEAYDRISNIAKSSLGLWKDKTYKGFKNEYLNRENHLATTQQQSAKILRELNREVNDFAEKIHSNPKAYAEERRALRLGDNATEEQVRKAVHDDLSRAVERERQQTLSKNDVYKKFGARFDETGKGRFLIAAPGQEAREQGQAIIDEIKNDYFKATGRNATDEMISMDANGFLNATPEVATFMRRESNLVDRLSERNSLYGSAGKYEGAIRNLAKTGKLELHLEDPMEHKLLEFIKKTFGNRIKGKISAGKGFARLTLTTKEIEELLKTNDIRELLEGSREFSKIKRISERNSSKIEELERMLHVTQDFGNNPEIKVLQDEIDEILSRQEKTFAWYLQRNKEQPLGKNTEGLLKIKQLENEISIAVNKLDKKIAKLQGRKLSLEQTQKELNNKVSRQQSTINKIVKDTDMNITPETTNAELSQELTKPPVNKVVLESDAAVQKEIQQFNATLERINEWNDKNFYEIKFSEPVLLNINSEFARFANVLESNRVKLYDDIEKILGDNSAKFKDVIDSLNTKGYMRHVINKDAMVYKEISRLKKMGGGTPAERRALISKLGSNARFFEQNWYGSAADINDRLGIELFNTNPIEAQAVALKLLPQHFEATNLIQSAYDTKLIRELSREEFSIYAKAVEDNLKAGMKSESAKLEAARTTLPKEFKIIDEATKKSLVQSFEFIKEGGASGAEVQALQKQIQDIEESQGMIMHKGVINQIKRYGKKLGNQDVNKVLDAAQKWFVKPFKSLATLTVGFHVRNNITNLSNAYLAGMKPHEYMRHFSQATAHVVKIERQILPKILKVMKSGAKETKTIEGQMAMIKKILTPEEYRLMNKMNEWHSKGIIGVNRFSEDLNTILSGIKDVNSPKAMDVIKNISDTSMKIGKLSDDASKIAAYEFAKNTEAGKKILAMHGMEHPEEFSRFVFFDYTDLSDFEQRYMKTIMPFYTWARKNFEFQLKNAAKQPYRYIKMNKALTNWQRGFMDSDDDLSEYDKQRLLMPVFRKDGKITLMKVSPAYLEITETLKNPLTQLSPLIKAPLESMTGINFFTHKESSANPLTQLGSETLGSFGELKNVLTGDEVDKTKLGLLGTRLYAPANAFRSLMQGQASASTMMPSVFRESDVEKNKINAMKQRVYQSKEYLRGLQAKGQRPTTNPRQYRPTSTGLVKPRKRY